MSSTRMIIVLIIVSTILLSNSLTNGGPARSFALAARAAKIPRSIRAPFRNTAIMTARGFGKRSQLKLKESEDSPWSFGKREAKFLEQLAMDNGDNASDLIGQDQYNEYMPIDWIADEMANNPKLIRIILRRFVDTNNDGNLSARELFWTPSASSSSEDSSNLMI